MTAVAGMAHATINLSASAGNGQVTLNWSYSNETPVVQEVYRDTDSNPSGRLRIGSVSSGTRTFNATGLSNGTTYYFWIKNSSGGTATNSNTASATPSGGGGGGGGGGGITGATCTSQGSTSVTATIRITSGTYNGGCRTYNPSGALGDGTQEEGQDPAFRVENGATLQDAILGNNGVDGVHFYAGGTLRNFRWTNVGEDAFTVKSQGNVLVENVTGVNSEDKFAQVNAITTLTVRNCIVDNAGKFLRQNGGTTFAIDVRVSNCRLSNFGEGVFRTDSSSSVASLTNSQLRNSGSLCIGSWQRCTGSGNTSF